MKLLVGLGNPGSKYEKTRHNVGFRFLDLLAESEGLRFAAAPRFQAETSEWEHAGEKVLLVKPQTYMNHSGEAIGKLSRYYHVEPQDIFVVYDDLELPAGKPRLKAGGGHGGHNGLKSLNQQLPSTDYIRIKIGIGRPPSGDVTPWVLGVADAVDRAAEEQAVKTLLAEIGLILAGNIAKASNHIHLALQEAQETKE